jgi:hypothetical protein
VYNLRHGYEHVYEHEYTEAEEGRPMIEAASQLLMALTLLSLIFYLPWL